MAAPGSAEFQGTMASLTPDVGAVPSAHEHRSSRADQRVWLEAVPDVAATMRLHSFCVDCGVVRSQLRIRGRPLGYFQQAIANLKAILEDDPRYPKLAQVHSRLIAHALESIPDFGDPYSMAFENQWDLFAESVRRWRPDLDEEFVAQALPREPRRARPAFIELIKERSQEAREPVALVT